MNARAEALCEPRRLHQQREQEPELEGESHAEAARRELGARRPTSGLCGSSDGGKDDVA
jgi:hypothetical protein